MTEHASLVFLLSLYSLGAYADGPEQPVSLYSIGVEAWHKVYNNNTIDFATRQQKVELGLSALRKAVAAWSDSYDVGIQSVTFGQRSLEDVFLELTGRELRDE